MREQASARQLMGAIEQRPGIGRGVPPRRSDHRQGARPEKIRRRARNALSPRRPVSIWARNPSRVMSARPGPRFERSVVIRALASGDRLMFVTDLIVHWRRSERCPNDRGNHHRRQNGAGQRLIVVHTAARSAVMLELPHLLQARQAKIPIQLVDEIPHDRIPSGPMLGG